MTKNDYEKIFKELTKFGQFNEHIDLPDAKNIASIDENFDYQPNTKLFLATKFVIRSILSMLGPIFTFACYRLKIEGKENLKDVKSGITVSNHVFKTDYLINRQCLSKKEMYVTGASVHYKKGITGYLFKAGGFLPISSTFSTQKKLNNNISTMLKTNKFVHFYAEQSMWQNYKKSRPFKNGAFMFACKNNVPIIPIVICFRKPPKLVRWYRKNDFVTAKIGKPIYPNAEFNGKSQIEELKQRTQKEFDDCIIKHYNYNKENYSYLYTSSNGKFTEDIKKKVD